MIRRLSLVVVACAVLVAVVRTSGQSRRFIADTDLFKFISIADPQISPDGSTVSFVAMSTTTTTRTFLQSRCQTPSEGV